MASTNILPLGKVYEWRSRHSNLQLSDFPSPDSNLMRLEKMPYVRHFYFPFEINYDGAPILMWSRKHYWLAPTFGILYLIFIWLGPRYMRHRKAFDLRGPLKCWNFLLAFYSTMGAIRVIPYLAMYLYTNGLHSSLCAPPVFTYGRGATGLWTVLFIYSKYIELIDTVFLVLRKRDLNFLHWYHHVTVLMYTWDAFVTEQPPGIYYAGMNYAVHSVMYTYYFLAAAMKKPPKWGMTVTILQILQMIAGVIITLVSLRNAYVYPFMYRATLDTARNPKINNSCYVAKGNMLSACGMYSTYFYLFARFFVRRYITGGNQQQQHQQRAGHGKRAVEETVKAVAQSPGEAAASISAMSTEAAEHPAMENMETTTTDSPRPPMRLRAAAAVGRQHKH